ncbi:MAG: efflux RND transporter periplasmic adaptor subunit [Vibrio sp.]
MWLRLSTKRLLIASLLGSSVIGLVGCEQEAAQTQQQAGAALPVEVATMQTQQIYVTNNLPGRVIPYRIAEVRPQVNGIVLKRLFEEGADVKEGDVLYQIEPSTYRATLNNAKAELAKAQADESMARKTKNRYTALVNRHVVSKQDFDNAEAEWQQAVAGVKVAQANVESAEINLEYTKIRAPISGRIGISKITEGALVTSGQADYLTTIQQLDPIYVDMTQASNQMSRIHVNTAQGKSPDVTVTLNNGQEYARQGKIAFSDISVDQTTGSQTIRALMPNPDKELLPGMYVRGSFKNTDPLSTILVPQKSVQRNSQGKPFVYLVDENNKVVQQSIELGEQYQSSWIVNSGLSEGDRVVQSNLLKVKPEMTVNVVEPQKETKATSTAEKSASEPEVMSDKSEGASQAENTQSEQAKG